MGDISTVSLVLLAVFFLFSAFFSGSEAALLSVQRIRIQQMANAKVPGAALVARLVDRPDKLLPPILIGNNIVNTGAAALATAVAASLIEDEGQAIIAATAAVTLILLIFGEITPKSLAATHPERFSILVAIPIRGLMILLTPISFLLQLFSSLMVRLSGGRGNRAAITQEEIKAMVHIGWESGAVEHEEAEMIRRVLEFGDRKVREVMTPRPEIVWVEGGTSIKEFLAIYNNNYHTRFPAYYGNVDNVIGVVSVKDIMRMLATGASMDDSVTAYVRPIIFVPETKRIQELFDEMRLSGAQLAMVADEFGGIAGLVTLKRLIEGIVGRAAEEDVQEQPTQVVSLGDNSFEVDAGMSVTDANERMGLEIPQGEYETVAGFLLEKLGKVPEPGDSIEFNGLSFTVAEMRGVRIARVHVTRVIMAEQQQE